MPKAQVTWLDAPNPKDRGAARVTFAGVELTEGVPSEFDEDLHAEALAKARKNPHFKVDPAERPPAEADVPKTSKK